MTDEDLAMRSDARANRDRVVAVARAAFAASPDASLNSIAKAAGVGPGTLYRHFPTRQALIIAVYRKEINALVGLAPALLAEHPPLEAFRRWCDRLADYGRLKHGLTDLIHAGLTERDRQETYWPMVEALRTLLAAGVAAGDFRAGIDAEDALLLLGFLWRIDPVRGGAAQAERLIDLVINGFARRQ